MEDDSAGVKNNGAPPPSNNANAAGPANTIGSGLASPVDDDLSLPRATVYKLIMELLPSGVGCSKETRDLLVDCCNEFVHLISSEANDICEKSGRKTIAPEHVIESLRTLGFADYLDEVQAAHEDHQTQNKEKERLRASSKAEAAKLSPEELLQQQEALFEQARLKYQQAQIHARMQQQQQPEHPDNLKADTSSSPSTSTSASPIGARQVPAAKNGNSPRPLPSSGSSSSESLQVSP